MRPPSTPKRLEDGEMLLQLVIDREETARRLVLDGRLSIRQAHDPVCIAVALAEVLLPLCGPVYTPLPGRARRSGTAKRRRPRASTRSEQPIRENASL